MTKSFITQFLEHFPRSVRFTPTQNRELASLDAFTEKKPIEQINKLALDLGLQVTYRLDGSIIIAEKG